MFLMPAFMPAMNASGATPKRATYAPSASKYVRMNSSISMGSKVPSKSKKMAR